MNEMAGPDGYPSIDQQVRELTARVGERVRLARKQQKLSRRELSERSDVSQRYLAQIESGEGNISIAVLLKVGRALRRDLEWFLDQTTDDAGIDDLFARADEKTRKAVLDLLRQGNTSPNRGRRVALIGLRGAGKSTLGRRLARRVDATFVELNDLIEDAAGMPVAEVIALYGQEGYRALEHRALEQSAETEAPLVLAVAGGIVSAPETFDLLLDRFHTVWLKAEPQEHMDRVRAQGDERPMAGNPAAMEELKAILAGRETQYARADCTVDTSGRGEEESLNALLKAAAQHRFIG